MCRIDSSSLQLAFCIPNPSSSGHIIFGSNGIVPYQPQSHFGFARDFCFPRMSKGSVHTIAVNMFVH
jgi:hypothetical protein